MRIIDEDCLRSFRGPGVCEYCGKRVRKRHPHHLHTRGAGRIDAAINLVSLCETFAGGDNCHDRVHNGAIDKAELLDIVARREGMSVDAIVEMIYAIRQTPKPLSADVRAPKRKKPASAWAKKAGELRRAAARAAYQRAKAWKKAKQIPK